MEHRKDTGKKEDGVLVLMIDSGDGSCYNDNY